MQIQIKLCILALACAAGVSATQILQDSESERVARCTYFEKTGYGYTNPLISLDSLKNRIIEDDTSLSMTTLMKVNGDAITLLSTLDNATQQHGAAPVYETVVGGSNNQNNFIRGGYLTPLLESVARPGIVSDDKWTFITHRLYKNGTLSLYADDELAPFISHFFDSPLNITHFSFCSWDTKTVKVYYDCAPTSFQRVWTDNIADVPQSSLIAGPINVQRTFTNHNAVLNDGQWSIVSTVLTTADWTTPIHWDEAQYDNITTFDFGTSELPQTFTLTVKHYGQSLDLPVISVTNEGLAHAELTTTETTQCTSTKIPDAFHRFLCDTLSKSKSQSSSVITLTDTHNGIASLSSNLMYE